MKTIKLIFLSVFVTGSLTACGAGGLTGLADSVLYPFAEVNKRYPVPENPPEGLDQVTFNVTATDGSPMSIHSWTYTAPDPNARAFVFLHGNGENLQALTSLLQNFKKLEMHFIAIDYPGLGRSTNKPNQENLVNAALAAIDWAAEQHPHSPLIVWGRSLGASVATIATSRVQEKVSGLIITSGWTNFLAVAREKTKLIDSVSKEWLAQNKYDSAAAAGTIHVPTIIHHGTLDKVIPIKFGRLLSQAFPANNTVSFNELTKKEHNDVFTESTLWQDVKAFLK